VENEAMDLEKNTGSYIAKERELAEFATELRELTESGVLKSISDFDLWLQDVEEECKYCFPEIKKIVSKLISYK